MKTNKKKSVLFVGGLMYILISKLEDQAKQRQHEAPTLPCVKSCVHCMKTVLFAHSIGPARKEVHKPMQMQTLMHWQLHAVCYTLFV